MAKRAKAPSSATPTGPDPDREMAAAARAAAEGREPPEPAISGGPGEPESTGPEPELEELEIGGVKYQMPKAAATAVRGVMERTSSVESRLDEMNTRLLSFAQSRGHGSDSPGVDVRQTVPITPKPGDTEALIKELETGLFQEPGPALRKLIGHIRESIGTELRGEYTKEQGQQRFWDEFYRQHEDLDRSTDHFIAAAVLNENLPKLTAQNITVGETIGKLGDLVRTEILRVAKKYQPTHDDTGEGGEPQRRAARTTIEGPSTPGPATPAQPTTPVSSLSSFLRMRKENRRKAAAGGE